jgi:hypothetical protein
MSAQREAAAARPELPEATRMQGSSITGLLMLNA